MNTIQNLILKLTFLLLVGFSGIANAVTLTNKISAVSTFSSNAGNIYTIKISGYELQTSASHTGELAQDAFFRKLNVTVEFDFGTYIPNYGYVGNKLTRLTIHSIDLP